jgi:hypothetical protein
MNAMIHPASLFAPISTPAQSIAGLSQFVLSITAVILCLSRAGCLATLQAEPEKQYAGGFSPKPTPLVRLSIDLLRFFDGERPGARCDHMQVVSACGNRPELVRLLPVA